MHKKIIVLTAGAILLFSCQAKVANENGNRNSLEKTTGNTNAPRVFSSADLSPLSASDLNARIGNVEMGDNCAQLFIPNSDLSAGDKVQIILTDKKPQQVFQMEIAEIADCADIWPGGEKELFGNDPKAELSSYTLKLLSENKNTNFAIGIGVINLNEEIRVENGLAVVDLDADKSNEYFRSCYGNESSVLTVWKGKPLIGKRIWFTQYRFNFDTVPSCKDKDYE